MDRGEKEPQGRQDRALFSVTDQDTYQDTEQVTVHDTIHDKSLIHKEKGQGTVHDTIQNTVHDERQVSVLTEDEPSRKKGSVRNF